MHLDIGIRRTELDAAGSLENRFDKAYIARRSASDMRWRSVRVWAATGLLSVAGALTPPARAADAVTTFATVETVSERNEIPSPSWGYTVLVKETGRLHRWDGATWNVLYVGGIQRVNVKDYGAVGDGVTDDTAAIKAAAARVESWPPVFMGELYFPPGTYCVTDTVSHACRNLTGEGATIDGPGPDKALLVSDGPIYTTIRGLTFRNFGNVIRCWSTNTGAGGGTPLVENCRFINGDYVMVDNYGPNVYPIFHNLELENCNLFKGWSDGVQIDNVWGTTKTNDWTGGWCVSGGTDDGIGCLGVAAFHVNNVRIAPAGVNTNATADQSWFRLENGGWQGGIVPSGGGVYLNNGRFGDEGGGIPLVKNVAIGARVMICGLEHHSSWRPRYVCETPLVQLIEHGVSGTSSDSAMYASEDAAKYNLNNNPVGTQVRADSRFLVLNDTTRSKGVSTVSTVNYNANATPYAVFDENSEIATPSDSISVPGAATDAAFEGLQGRRFTVQNAEPEDFTNRYCAAGPRLNASLSFQALSNRIYNLTLFYRSKGLKGLSFTCTNETETSRAAGLADTGGRLARGNTSVHAGQQGLHVLACQAEFCAADGFLEIYPITITEGPFGAAYLSGPQWSGDPDPAPGADSVYSQHQTTLHFMGAAAPTNGVWRKGSVVYNNNPGLGAPFGWVCIAGGTPGEWCVVGSIGN